ncbi:MAG: hypothetical protein WA862_02220 [Solirubrobacterales bacterium]
MSEAREPLPSIHGLGGSRSIWEPVIGLLEPERGIERPHVAGNSLGGWVVLKMGRCG